jgi:cytochrome c oxidase subunit II
VRRDWAAAASLCLVAVAAAMVLGGCGTPDSPSILRPESPGAQQVRNVTYVLLAISIVIFLVVETLLVLAIVRFRGRREEEAVQTYGSRKIEILWTAIPVVIVIVIFAITVATMRTPQLPGDALLLRADGRAWWWDFSYPQADFASPNEIHVPVDRPVDVELTSSDVIHSFWMPQIGGKTDMVPGKLNRQSFTVITPGQYLGICGEYCGVQHAHMQFVMVAESPEEFSAWVARQQQPAEEPEDGPARQGMEAFLALPCAGCHSIRGTDAVGRAGPDLTHVGSRLYLAAGTLENDDENMARWLRDPQGVKPGNLMPNSPLSEEQVQQLVEYMKGLQ